MTKEIRKIQAKQVIKMAKNNNNKNTAKKTTIDKKQKAPEAAKKQEVKIKAEQILKNLNKVDDKLGLSILGHNDIFEGEILKFKDYYLGKERYFEVVSITKSFITDTITVSNLELKEITENENENEEGSEIF